jgi:hypothetical protein
MAVNRFKRFSFEAVKTAARLRSALITSLKRGANEIHPPSRDSAPEATSFMSGNAHDGAGAFRQHREENRQNVKGFVWSPPAFCLCTSLTRRARFNKKTIIARRTM